MLGRKVYRQVKRDDGEYEFVEVRRAALPSDLRFDSPFRSPVDGSLIRNKWDLHDHNQRNGVVQVLPGMDQDINSIQKENIDRITGKRGRQERIEAIRRAIELGER